MSNAGFKDFKLRHALPFMLVFVVGLLAPVVTAQPFREYPPQLPPNFFGIPLNGGRVQSIAVNPTDSNHIIAAHQFGGLWQTENGGRNWSHLSGLAAVFVVDVAYAPDGRTVIATVMRDTKTVNGGGIWVSRNEGQTWEQPGDGSGTVPATVSGLMRTSAWGISYAPDDSNKIYVATDYGIAISTDNGGSWSHRLLEPAGPTAFAVQGLSRNRAIAVTQTAIYLKDAGDTWRVVRRGWFSDNVFGNSIKKVDVSPYDNEKVFILQDYNTLLLYDVGADTWAEIPLPGGGSRGGFVRAARGVSGPPSIDLFIGVGVGLYKASCTDLGCFRTLRCDRASGSAPATCDWQLIGRAQGVHDDCGHLGLDAQKRPVMFGSDGGLFKPTNPEATNWTLASPGGSGMNSYQITSLAGTNYGRGSTLVTSLYFATQDNGIWASADGGRTWPNADCAEGWHMQTWHEASSSTDPAARVAYGSTGCWGRPRISDANLLNQREALPWRSTYLGGGSFVLSDAFLLSPRNWMRFENGHYFFIDRTVGYWSLAMSTDNLERWREVGVTDLNPSGSVFKAGSTGGTTTAYTTFEGALRDSSNNPRIALARMRDVLRVSPGTITEENLLYLPRGSLGIRATEFDWHPIYGVDPADPTFLIAPDVVNGVIWKSTTGGDTWIPDDELTDRVTQGRRLLLYDAHPYRLQVTEIAFSPYERNLILVGTRDAGIVYSEDRGNTWQTIPGSDAMRYITGFFFTPNGKVYVSTYGRGLWTIDMWWRWRQVPIIPICGFSYEQCIVRLRPDATQNVIKDFPWKEHNVLVVFGGRINGLVRSGDQVKSITVTPNASYRLYTTDKQQAPEITESKEGAGFQDDAAAEYALKNQEVITGVIFKGSQPVGYLTSKAEFKADQEAVSIRPGKEVPADKPGSGLPYLSISTESPVGPGMVQAGGVIYLIGKGFIQGVPVEVLLDEKKLSQATVGKDGQVNYTLKVDEQLSMGQHRVAVVQQSKDGERKAVATFVKVRDGDREKQ